MGKVSILTKEQNIILAEVKKSGFLSTNFYFTGGTALSAFYLQHRYSEDLDFFSEKNIDTETIFTFFQDLSRQHSFTFTSEFQEVVYIFLLKFNNTTTLKVDFGYYPYKQIEKPNELNGIKTDSLTDIAVNKFLTITQRNTVKDFVDLYFLLEKFTVWELIEGVRIKFRMQLEPFILASDFLKVEDFSFLPRMIAPLTLGELKSFYRQKAQDLGKKSVK
ncbi:MAG: nucleotidyl transferase AbiEii/AbiGii toxin family protein [Patescibacteria group bacterium]